MAHQLPEDMSFVQAALLGKSLEVQKNAVLRVQLVARS